MNGTFFKKLNGENVLSNPVVSTPNKLEANEMGTITRQLKNRTQYFHQKTWESWKCSQDEETQSTSSLNKIERIDTEDEQYQEAQSPYVSAV